MKPKSKNLDVRTDAEKVLLIAIAHLTYTELRSLAEHIEDAINPATMQSIRVDCVADALLSWLGTSSDEDEDEDEDEDA